MILTPANLTALRAMLEERKRTLAQERLGNFVRLGWEVLEPTTRFIPNWHIDAICEHLEAVTAGQIKDLVINIPPGHMKSLLANVFWPAWMWLRRPSWRALFYSYADNLVRRDTLKFRALIGSDWYAGLQPDFTIAKDTETLITNDKTGLRMAGTVAGATTGHRGDAIIVDDPHNVLDMKNLTSAALTSALWWWDQAMANRLNDLSTGTRVIIMQRLRQDDLAGHVLAEGGWEHLCLPTEYDPARHCVTNIGWEDPRQTPGDLLFPEKFPAPTIAKEKLRLGSYGYAGQHQQRPAPAGGGKFQRAWFRYFSQDETFYHLHQPGGTRKAIFKRDCWTFTTSDLALSQDEQACWTVISTWAVTKEGDLLLLHVHRLRAEAPDVKDELLKGYTRWSPTFLGVEKAHFGTAICQELRRTGLPIKELIADRDKVTRSMPASIRLEAGGVYFLERAPWLTDWESELEFFPNGQFDDQVDTFSYAAIVQAEMAKIQQTDVLKAKTQPAATQVPAASRGQTPRKSWQDITG